MNNKVQYLIEKELVNIGLRPGDNVLVHSDSTVVRELTGLKWADSLVLLKNCFLNILGNNGTLIVPTFNWDFCKGKPYVHEKTRSQVGMFTNNILFDDRSLRSFHPIYSFAAIGPKKKVILNNISKSSFGNNSVFYKLHELNAKIILFNFDLGTTFVHYVEQKIGVNYRYFKNFTGSVTKEGVTYDDSFDFYVRRLDYDVDVNLSRLHESLYSRGKMKCSKIDGKYNLKQFNCNDIYNLIEEKLKNEPYFLLSNPLSIPIS